VKYVLVYTSAENLDMDRVGAHYEAHRARWKTFHDQGTLLMIGPFADPRDGAMAVFTTAEAAEDFATGDPFVLHDIVSAWTVKEWNEALM
jgi:hypothetical protein